LYDDKTTYAIKMALIVMVSAVLMANTILV
jgi:hypothetical protein